MTKTKKISHGPKNNFHKKIFILLCFLAIVINIIYSFNLRWLGDDIFIGLRYVQNFVSGNGLVYNIGEHVEGYTDFLWIVLIGFFNYLGFTPENIPLAIGILSSAIIVILFSFINYKLFRIFPFAFIPFIPLALALNHDYNIWATSGLEVSFFTLLLVTAFFIFFFTSSKETFRYLFSGLFICLSFLTRPDGLIIFVLVNALIISGNLIFKTPAKIFLKRFALFNLSVILIYVPYFLWRYNYYGFIFPNTYYAKLGNESLFQKGLFYIWLYFKPHFTSFLFLILPPIIFIQLLKNKSRENFKLFFSDRINAAFITCLLVVFTYLIGFVAKVGGDFMHARFIMPMVPFIYFIICFSCLKIFSKENINSVLAILLIASFTETYIRLQMFSEKDEQGNEYLVLDGDVADERLVSLPDIKEEKQMGLAMKNAFEGIPVKMLVRASQACLAYYTHFNYLQEYHGLTDTLIAHSKLTERGRIGHEKSGSLEYFENNGIHFNFDRSPLGGEPFRYSIFNIPPFRITTEIITFDNNIIDRITGKLGADFQHVDFRNYLDNYIKDSIPVYTPEKIRQDYEKFSLYYFRHNDDKQREQKFLNALK